MTRLRTLRPPGDKSLTHRALLLAALSGGGCAVRNPLVSLDTRATAAALRRLGVPVSTLRGTVVRVRGSGLRGLRAPKSTLHFGNSGTGVRLTVGVLAGHPFPVRITGDMSLRQRPMRRVTEPLTRMGATFREEQGDALPLTVIGGPLRPLDYQSPVASAQVKSALLLAGLVGGVEVSVTEPARSRDHTERMLAALGIACDAREGVVRFRPVSGFDPFDFDVPADPSSAAFLVAAAVLRGHPVRLVDVGLNPTRLGFVEALRRMGVAIDVAVVEERLGEPVGELRTASATLRPLEVEPDVVPSLIDEIPILAVLAARTEGATEFRGVGELRVKESDRLALLAANLNAIGAHAEADGDTLRVCGTGRPPSGVVDTGRDHRMAMAFAVLGRVPGADVRLSETASVAVSYPSFFHDLDAVTVDD